MCLSLHPSKMSDTILYATETLHQGKLVHVMGYQNKAENKSRGPNAMLLPIPAEGAMTQDNMLDTSMMKHVLTDYGTVVKGHSERRSRGLSKGLTFDSVELFNKGSYSVALAKNVAAIPEALHRIPANRRPAPNQAIFDAYANLYPGWWFALCAWDGSVDAEPLLWWYGPKDSSNLFLPGLDAHDGHAPAVGSTVSVDHIVAIGSPIGSDQGWPVRFQEATPAHLAPFISDRVYGRKLTGLLPNGDFQFPVSNIGKNEKGLKRVPPVWQQESPSEGEQ